MKVLGFETSCDETAVAVYDSTKGILANIIHSQLTTHEPYGGVVPELAARDHLRYLTPLTKQAMREAKVTHEEIDLIAYTKGPGLIGPLLVGGSFAKSLGFAWNIPCIGVHHLEGHLLAPMLDTNKPELPCLALLVSGGHTQLYKVKQLGEYELLGETLDDAAGEAFDKTAKMLGLGYPGGPAIEKAAKTGTKGKYLFPRPLSNQANLNFSFSGLKTHVANTVSKLDLTAENVSDVADALQEAIVASLSNKCTRAMQETGISNLVIAGGVAANSRLRHELEAVVSKEHGRLFFPPPILCTDNAAMIAYCGFICYQRGEIDKSQAIEPKSRWPL